VANPLEELVLVGATAPYLPTSFLGRQGPSPLASLRGTKPARFAHLIPLGLRPVPPQGGHILSGYGVRGTWWDDWPDTRFYSYPPSLMTFAHAIGGRSDLPVPIEYVVVGGGVVLLVSFLALAVLWKEPRFQTGPAYDGPGFSAPPNWILGLIGVTALFLVIGQLVVPVFGLETIRTRPTIAPVMVWVVFWLVVPFLSAVIGNWYADLNPWRSIARFYRMGNIERIYLVDTLGLWPSTVLFTAFIWLELIHPGSGVPVTLGRIALIYTVLLLVGVVLVGRETGLLLFDPFTTYNRLISAISPFGRSREGRLVWRGWLRSLAVVPEWKGLWVFVVAMIGTVTYDGASGTDWMDAISGSLVNTRWGQTLLLVLTIVAIGLAYLAASWVSTRVGRSGLSAFKVAQRFAHTLVPIALAYAFAHYFTLIIFEGQQLIAAISDPFALGWDLFGTADRRINFFVTTTAPIWYIQVASIVGGHILGVVLAHDRALADFGKDALRSQYAMLVLMIALTSLGLLVQTG